MMIRIRDAFLLVALLAASLPLRADDAEDRLRFMKASAEVYDARDASGRALTLTGEPLLRWNNAVSGLVDGTLWIWSDPDGRPVAAAQVFQTRDGLWLHEFQSLSEAVFTFSRDGAPVWAPASPGIEPAPLPDAAAPAADEVGRLVQMRSFARRFAASDRFEDKEDWELRLLPKPVVRYAGGPVRDGAVFAHVHTTDPEVLALIESRDSASGPRWHYSLVPMTGYAVEVKLDGRPVWDAPYRKPPFDPAKPFFITEYRP